MNINQMNAAQQAMIDWLSDQHEFGKKPTKIEYTENFEFNDMHYYIFKFKSGIFGKWLVGVSGGFEDDDIESCGHTFSDMKEYDPQTAKTECIAMVERIMDYWKKQADKF